MNNIEKAIEILMDIQNDWEDCLKRTRRTE